MQVAEPFWVVAKTKAQRESWAAENVARQGFDFYIPKTEPTKKPKQRRRFLKPQCLFPRYIFVKTNGRWRFLLSTYGVMGVVMQGQQPAVMPSQAIIELKAREGTDGLIMLPKASEFRFNNGDKVRVNSGMFSGYTGIYEHHKPDDRASILLEFLGRRTRVLIGEASLEAAE